MSVAKRIEHGAVASDPLAQGLGCSLLLQNDGSRSLGVIGDVAPENFRLVPGEVLEIDVSAPLRIIVYDGGVQLAYGPSRGEPGGARPPLA